MWSAGISSGGLEHVAPSSVVDCSKPGSGFGCVCQCVGRVWLPCNHKKKDKWMHVSSLCVCMTQILEAKCLTCYRKQAIHASADLNNMLSIQRLKNFH